MVHEKYLSTVNGDVAIIKEDICHIINEANIVFKRVILADQKLGIRTIPSARPVFVRPADAERQVWLPVLQQELQRLLQKSSPLKPIGIVAKAMNAVTAGQVCLLPARLHQSHVVETQIGGQPRRLVCRELRTHLGDVGPFSEARAPPSVVLRE